MSDSANSVSGDGHEVNTMRLSFTGRMASWSARHRWWVVGGAMLTIVFAVLVLMNVEAEIRNDGGGVGDSGIADKLFSERFGAPAVQLPPSERPTPRRTERLIFSNQTLGVDDNDFRTTVDGIIQNLRQLPRVASAVSFFDTNEPTMRSRDGLAVLGQVVLEAESSQDLEHVDDVISVVKAANGQNGFEAGVISSRLIEDELNEILNEDFVRILFISLGLGLVILILAFRALIAAIIPLIMAVGSIFTAISIATLVSQLYPLVEIYTEMVLLMGLAVGIDYSLFILSRFRTELASGRSKIEAIGVASNTTGRAVFYAGITVVLSLAGLMLTNDATFISLATGAIIVVLLAIIGSLTLLPAMLAILGTGVNRLKLPIIGRENAQAGIWGAITDRVLARPYVLAPLSAGILIALAIPLFFINIGFNAGADSLPDAANSKRALQLLEEHFTSSLTRPARIAVDAPDVSSPEVQAAVDSFIERLEQNDAFFAPFDVSVSPDNTLLSIRVPLAGKIDDEESEDGVRLLRNELLPEAFDSVGARAYVAGDTAEGIDFRDRMYRSAVYVFAFVLGLAFLLLLVMFRSLVIPIKAIILNLMSVGAAYGVLVMVFQWGWGIGILGSESTGLIEAWLPLFLFGILFGLSMDYHMLVLNRIKEEYDKSHNNTEAVSAGIRLTAGQITSAAAIMVGVFGTFATSRVIGLQQFGLGLGVAVLIDATLIRVVLLPASMKLLGDLNWYLPAWLDWLPRVSAEEGPPTTEEPIGQPADGSD